MSVAPAGLPPRLPSPNQTRQGAAAGSGATPAPDFARLIECKSLPRGLFGEGASASASARTHASGGPIAEWGPEDRELLSPDQEWRATAFDRASLFGNAVELPGLSGAQDSESTAPRSGAAAAPADHEAIATGHHVAVDSAASGLDAVVAGQDGGGRNPRGHAPTPPQGIAGPSPSPTRSSESRAGTVLGALNPAGAAGDAAIAESASARASIPGNQLRRSSVLELTPINVVVRPSPNGVQVATRIGGSLPVDDHDVERALAATVRAEGRSLAELHFNGRTQRKPPCP